MRGKVVSVIVCLSLALIPLKLSFGMPETAVDVSEVQASAAPVVCERTYKGVTYRFGDKYAEVWKISTTQKAVRIVSKIHYQGKVYKVISIAENACLGGQVKSLVLGKYIKRIGAKSFYSCDHLRKVVIKSKIVGFIGTGAFGKDKKLKKIYVPLSKFVKYHKMLGNRVTIDEDWLYSSTASSYGINDGCLGTATASGITRVTNSYLGVANKTMKFGTKVLFTFRGNSVVATVVDRGPYVSGRDWDLMPAVARSLHFCGLGTVKWRVVS